MPKKSLTFIDLKSHTSLIGNYIYKKMTQNVGYLEGVDMIGGNAVGYTLTFVCKNKDEGRYIFAQKSEGHDIKQITGVYYIIP
ncbi:hypothetical protein [uncultured Shewanella sp.]|uniref:hypothetical protein n=1 Tax=uncultured Shewanella sp. TaxID=173975 RepID=UPI00262C646D|nr:hypothetical protein [uncultured Shewanella sp.]